MVPSPTQDEQLEDLHRRYQLLEGEKKANSEHTSGQIRTNKETIRKLTDENNRLRSEIGGLSNRKRIESTDAELVKLKSRYNMLRSENARKQDLVEKLRRQVALVGPVTSTDSQDDLCARRIRVIENRIDKAMIKYNEAQSIKKTYENILKKLNEERIGFDHQLADLEKQLQGKRKEYDELVLLSHDAQHAKEMAQAELHRFEQAVLEERNQRDREVMEKKLLVQQRVEMNNRLEKAPPPAVPTPAPAAVTPNMETDGLSSTRMARAQPEEQLRLEHKLTEYEEGYKKLKEITGVSDVNEMIQKFITLDVTHDNLVAETTAQQRQLDSLLDEQGKLTAQLNDLKFSGGGRRMQGPQDMEDLLAESTAKLDKNRSRYEKLATVLIDVNAGIAHLYEKLKCVKIDHRDDSPVHVSDETVEEVLNVCELKVSKLMEQVPVLGLPSVAAEGPPPDVRIKPRITDSKVVDDGEFDPIAAGVSTDVFDRKLFKQNSEIFVEKIKKKQAAAAFTNKIAR